MPYKIRDIKESFVIQLDANDIRLMIQNKYPNHVDALRDDIRVTFRVPGGGDWSNTTIDIDAEHPITVLVVKPTTSERELIV